MIGELFLGFALLGAQWVLWLLLALSLVSVAVIVERRKFFRTRRTDTAQISAQAIEAVSEGSDMLEAEDLGAEDALSILVARAGVSAAQSGPEAASEAMRSAKARGRKAYENLLAILGTLGNNAPFIGLFGTVLGIVGAFDKLKDNPEGGIDVVGADLSEALVATAIGILVAVPAVVAFNYFNRRLKVALQEADEVAHAILSAVHSNKGD